MNLSNQARGRLAVLLASCSLGTAGTAGAAAAASTLAVSGCRDPAGHDGGARTQSSEESDRAASSTSSTSSTRTTAAQAEVDQKVAEESLEFARTRLDFEQEMESDLAAVDRRIERLEARARSSVGETKSRLEAILPEVHARRATLADDLSALGRANRANWDALKERVATDRAALESSFDPSSPPPPNHGSAR